MAIDVEKFLQPVTPEAPAGDDLEYDAAFSELERAAMGKPEQRMGDEIKPAEEPQWGSVHEMAAALLGRSRDLRIALHLMRADLHKSGLPALADGLRLMHGLLEKYWDTVHPRLDADDDNDPTIRMNSVAALNDRTGLISSLLRVPVVESKQLGKFNMRQVRLAGGEGTPAADEVVPEAALIDAAFMDGELDKLTAAGAAANTAAEELAAIDTLLREKVGVTRAPDLKIVKDEIASIRTLLNGHLQRRGVAAAGAAGAAAGAAAAPEAVSGQIQSREDAIRAIDRITDFFKKSEPSSPVPLLLQRAKRLIAKDFMEILKDLAPSGVEQVRIVSGKEKEEEKKK